ncbi:transposase [Streptomyces sp. NPDC101175]|uniref:IS110 family transposase n=1 Tax=Streptomyces sp. NPDC101175 TaxID=3366123 RepID=UPI003837BC86
MFYLLGERFEVWLVNARDIKRVPGGKTDVSDAPWTAQVTQHGLVSPSFVSPPLIRRLRDLTRQRTGLVRERSRALNRLEKVIEGACIKTSLVLTKTRKIVIATWCMLTNDTDYQDLGPSRWQQHPH